MAIRGYLTDFVAAGILLGAGTVPAQAPAGGETYLAPWAAVLERFVDARGRVDFSALAADRDDLDRFVAWVQRTSPASHPDLFPDRDAELAYHINAYNALAMQGVIDEGIPADFGSIFKRAGFFKLRKVIVGGQRTSLYDYENEVIRGYGDARVHFALNCMVRDCPRLPREPFRAATLDAQLDAAAREFLGDDANVNADHQARELRLSELLKFYTADFVGADRPQALAAYVNRYREREVPTDYRVRFRRYDWTINRQP